MGTCNHVVIVNDDVVVLLGAAVKSDGHRDLPGRATAPLALYRRHKKS